MAGFVIVETIPLLRIALENLIEDSELAELIGSYSDVSQLYNSMPGQIDWIWLDGTIPAIRNGEILPRLRCQFPKVKAIIFGLNDAISQIRKYYNQGAQAYITRDTSREMLSEALNQILHGKSYTSPEILERASDWLTKSASFKSKKMVAPPSTREMEVLKLIIDEFTSKEIAEKLFVSPATIETHRINLIQKLGVKNTAGLVRVAIEERMFSVSNHLPHLT